MSMYIRQNLSFALEGVPLWVMGVMLTLLFFRCNVFLRVD